MSGFGELRAFLQRPFHEDESWLRLSELLLPHLHGEEAEQVILPYVEAAIARWPQPRAKRLLPDAWIKPAYAYWRTHRAVPPAFRLLGGLGYVAEEDDAKLLIQMLDGRWVSRLEAWGTLCMGSWGKQLINAILVMYAWPSLRVVDLSWSSLSDAVMGRVLMSPLMASVEQLSFEGNTHGAATLEALKNSPHLGALRELTLGDCGASFELEVLEDCVSLSKLRAFSCKDSRLREVQFEALCGLEVMSALESLRVHLDFYEDRGGLARVLAQAPFLKTLTRLTVEYCSVTDDFVEVLGREAVALRCLELASHQISKVGVEALAHGVCPLEQLDLSASDEWSGEEPGLFSDAPGFANLSVLDLHSTRFTEESFRAFILSETLVGLKQLELWGTPLTSTMFELLAQSPWFGGLTSLSLQGTGLDDAGLAYVMRASVRPRLLGLYNNALSVKALWSVFAHEPWGESVERLILCRLSMEGISAHGALPRRGWRQLNFINASGCGMLDADARWLFSELDYDRLVIDLSGNEVSDALWVWLAQQPCFARVAHITVDTRVDKAFMLHHLNASPHRAPWFEVSVERA